MGNTVLSSEKDSYISAAELGRRVGLSNRTILTLVEEGKIVPAYISPTNRYRFSVKEVQKIEKEFCKMPDEYSVEDIVSIYGVDKKTVYGLAEKLEARHLNSRKLCFKKKLVDAYFEEENLNK